MSKLEYMEMELDEELTGQISVTLRDGSQVWGTESDLDESAYGAAAVAIVRDITKLLQEYEEKLPLRLTLARLAFSLGIMVANLICQGLILFYIYIFVVQPAVRHVQQMYKKFHKENFDAHGNLDDAAWVEYDDRKNICQITMSSREFYYGILLLWGLLMMMELRSCQRVASDIWGIKSVQRRDEMLEYVNTHDFELGGRCLIVGLTRGMRAAVLLLVCLPRALIGICLFYFGLEWLSASASFADMTLNAMALEFVKNIDEILYEAILPLQLRNQIAETNMFQIEKRKTKRDVDRSEWRSYRGTCIWLALMFGALGIYANAAQTVLPFDLSELKALCGEQIRDSQTPLCTKVTFHGWSEACFPYGPSSAHNVIGQPHHHHGHKHR